jgi:hypothetical protein
MVYAPPPGFLEKINTEEKTEIYEILIIKMKNSFYIKIIFISSVIYGNYWKEC